MLLIPLVDWVIVKLCVESEVSVCRNAHIRHVGRMWQEEIDHLRAMAVLRKNQPTNVSLANIPGDFRNTTHAVHEAV